MKRRFRLSRSTDIQRVRRSGKSYAQPLIVLGALPNESGALRFAFVAGRSLGGAVLRNRSKRLMRAALHPILSQLAPGWDVVLIARRPLLEAPFPEICQTLAALLQRAGILRSHDE